MSEPFGFRVEKTGLADLWKVELPEQYDPWTIAGVKYYGGVPHAEAVAELTRFIAEAQVALVALTERREVSA